MVFYVYYNFLKNEPKETYPKLFKDTEVVMTEKYLLKFQSIV
jgi:hypothetical protein